MAVIKWQKIIRVKILSDLMSKLMGPSLLPGMKYSNIIYNPLWQVLDITCNHNIFEFILEIISEKVSVECDKISEPLHFDKLS